MDALHIAKEAITLIKPLLAQGIDNLGDEAGNEFWPFIKSIFKSKNKEELISDIESKPEDESNFVKAQTHLQSILLDDPALTGQLKEKISRMKENGFFQKITGDKNNTIGTAQNSTIVINQQ
ncbi:hypothetical protein BEL04_08695 [Mucilaginibacter sp. PPCGB 2223]|uniref:hypothetical protein n=1 Tax=Mucilaginibacter sp. PPCGB 2223 TaxID=1886027 RepID=UPI000826A1F8|nr:hypothetical protein [Mucilaginibacter sp. PPCGB 2223]OCX54327.1 hypothetical protein BEL04_08695 [Mucilaginibacter sp. PPCGB 2223]